MGEIVDMSKRRKPSNPGNGAREALISLFAGTNVKQPDQFADTLLTEMWVRGFKVVPLDPSDDR